MKILKAVVITSSAPDQVFLQTDVPSALSYEGQTQSLCLRFEAKAGTGKDYVNTHFPNVPVEIQPRPFA